MTAGDVSFDTTDPTDPMRSETAERARPAPAEDARLELLLPPELKTDYALSPADSAELSAVLGAFLQALQLDHAAGLCGIEACLDRLTDMPRHPARVEAGTTSALDAQICDFDAYFRVDRITSDAPAHALVRGLLQTARANMSLFCRAEYLPPRHVAQQIAAFAEYAHLLARVCDLGELS
ncbi:hypothetical protein GOZ83_28470 [Agrobacterium vitis]|uniref:hypothetical protein n=1 Tax=Rhizobium/Agrobacterium group TaxID=227290 RepID=UPI0012E93A5C|nr:MULTISPECIES: hypothetical protein [Rhizobium/Agrobacterium group]MCF1496232.1 hypothetical protein [Allorhizobium ampelinum]MVA48945.1 hypothetical protein [Agrobacterium vitis]